MRDTRSPERRLDSQAIDDIELNFDCRDEIIPILATLQYVHSEPQLRDGILDLIGRDVNSSTNSDRGREGMPYWQILVLAAVRLGCNFDYDRLHDLADNHRTMRHIMGLGD